MTDSRQLYLSQLDDLLAQQSVWSHTVTPGQVVFAHTLLCGCQDPHWHRQHLSLASPPKRKTSHRNILNKEASFHQSHRCASTVWVSFCTGVGGSSCEVSIAVVGDGGRGRSATSPTSSTVTKSLRLNGNGSNSSSVSIWRTDPNQVCYSNYSTHHCNNPIYKWGKHKLEIKGCFFSHPRGVSAGAALLFIFLRLGRWSDSICAFSVHLGSFPPLLFPSVSLSLGSLQAIPFSLHLLFFPGPPISLPVLSCIILFPCILSFLLLLLCLQALHFLFGLLCSDFDMFVFLRRCLVFSFIGCCCVAGLAGCSYFAFIRKQVVHLLNDILNRYKISEQKIMLSTNKCEFTFIMPFSQTFNTLALQLCKKENIIK